MCSGSCWRGSEEEDGGVKYVLFVTTIVALCTTAPSKDKPQQETCTDNPREYSQVLDAYFSNARGNSSTAIVLRVYGSFQAEYEIVLDPQLSNRSLFLYAPEQPIWGNVYNLNRPHRTMGEYGKEAIRIPFLKREIVLTRAEFRDLFARASRIDTSICEDRAKKHLATPAHDAFEFEMISEKNRIRVFDSSGSRGTSPNPPLLKWALDVQKASGVR